MIRTIDQKGHDDDEVAASSSQKSSMTKTRRISVSVGAVCFIILLQFFSFHKTVFLNDNFRYFVDPSESEIAGNISEVQRLENETNSTTTSNSRDQKDAQPFTSPDNTTAVHMLPRGAEKNKGADETTEAPKPPSAPLSNYTPSNGFGGGTRPLTCQNDTGLEICCGAWDAVSSDAWWTHHPDWDVSMENDTHYCFEPVQNPEKAAFLRHLHQHQEWDNPNCTNVERSVEVNSGFGASTTWLQKAFWHALRKSNKPFQIIHNYRTWLYATANSTSWAYCDTQDSRCYYLPIQPCNRTDMGNGMEHRELGAPRAANAPLVDRKQYLWMAQYLFRRRQHFRKQLYDFRHEHRLDEILDLPSCVTMHVRRGDAGIPRPPFRRYAPVQEYLDALGSSLKQNDTIFLLTDDQSTIEEVQKYHMDKNINWRYLKRPRVQNIQGGFDGHIPSGDPAFEMLVLDTELTVASHCDRIVYGNSGFVGGMLNKMELDGKAFTQYHVETTVSKTEAKKFGDKNTRVKSLMQDLDTHNQNITSGWNSTNGTAT